MASVFLHLGSNSPESQALLRKALSLISESLGTILQESQIYETEPWGVKDQPNFLNMAIEVKTSYAPQAVLKIIKDIEVKMGRKPTTKWGPRLIDIDILFYDNKVIKSDDLTIPHPHIQNRNFVLIPLMEIAGTMIHPTLEIEIEELYMNSEDECEVWLFDNE